MTKRVGSLAKLILMAKQNGTRLIFGETLLLEAG
jgi:hypothetical protein